ncbi:MAG: DUF1934 domain-containing protein [Eubacteriales bacterium]|nr:DUF1934 domain-containing protein [Eubacteriales bacterium]
MASDVMVSIIGEQTNPNGEINRIEMMTEGRVYEDKGVRYIEYDEQEALGTGYMRTQLSVAGGVISLVRQGQNTTHMVFAPGKKSYNTYYTPVGTMEMSIFPTLVHLEMGEEEGEVELEYQLELGGHYAGTNMLSLVYHKKTAAM